MKTAPTKALLAEALGLAPSKVSESTNLETCEAWDSLAHFRVIAAIEEALGRSLSTQEIFKATDYAGVEEILSKRALNE